MVSFFSSSTRTIGFGVLLCVGFLLWCTRYFGFVVDDAFIAFRYAENLAQHGSITWNLGQDPVEGFTSFLWVIFNALAIVGDVSPLLFSKGVSIGCVLLIIGLLLWKGDAHPWYLQLGIPAAIAFSPAIAVLTVQGLETMGAALLVLITSAVSVQVLRCPGRRAAALWYGCAFVAGLMRPDTLVFNMGIFATLTVLFYSSERSGFYNFFLTSLPFILLGIGYMGWRLWYFGHLLPNPAYLKSDSLGGGVKYTATFFARVLVPYLLVGVVAFSQASKKRIAEILPTVIGAGLFAVYLVNVKPIQGFLWRYAVPVFPALLYISLHLHWPVEPAHREGQFAMWMLGLTLVLFPFHTYPETKKIVEARSPNDRIAVGKALQGLEGRLFTSESGALAYYSEWSVLDFLGLNSEEIAHGTSRRVALQKFDPDLVGMLAKGSTIVPTRRRWAPILPYLQKNNFVGIAATQKSASKHHLYFVDPTSSLCDEVITRLRGIDSVSYTPVKSFVSDSLRIPVVSFSNKSASTDVCRSVTAE